VKLKKLILVGGGGHCRSCIDVIETEGNFHIEGILDVPEKKGSTVFTYPVIGDDTELEKYISPEMYFLITVGQIKSSETRQRLFYQLKKLNANLAAIVSPLAMVSSHSSIGEGTIVMHQSLVNGGADIGKNCILNSKSLIEHDAVIGDHCHISTGAIANGAVQIGNGVFLGSNTVIKESIKIGQNCVIGAGAVLRHDIEPDSTFVG
jgi:sugar O-acyltransferase (sialic acid O-acetyltransferase NeuD family)